MNISQVGVDLIKDFEGYEVALKDGSCKAYWDADGRVWTIGWGCTEGVKQGDVWTRQQAEERFAIEVAKHVAFVGQQAPWANQNEYDAMASFSYNGGPGMLRQLLSHGPDKSKIAAAFLLFDKAGRPLRTLKGLTRRRKAESALFSKPISVATVKPESAIKPTGEDYGMSSGDGAPQPGLMTFAKVSAGSQTLHLGLASGVALLWGYLCDGLHTVFNVAIDLFGVLPDIADQADTAVGTGEKFSTWLGLPFEKISISVVLVITALMIGRHLRDKYHLKLLGG